jgi:hypothetical protein
MDQSMLSICILFLFVFILWMGVTRPTYQEELVANGFHPPTGVLTPPANTSRQRIESKQNYEFSYY